MRCKNLWIPDVAAPVVHRVCYILMPQTRSLCFVCFCFVFIGGLGQFSGRHLISAVFTVAFGTFASSLEVTKYKLRKRQLLN